MENMHRITYALAALVFVTAVFSIATRGKGNDSATQLPTVGDQQPNAAEMQRRLTANRAYPIADYDEAEPADPTKRAARREKQKRHNKFGMVMKDPHPETVETSFIEERAFDFPGLPVDKSEVIVIGEVVTGEAHLSEDKQNVFSEFAVKITKVLKSPTSTAPKPGSLITIERIGGYVRYANGRTVLYRGSGYGMPRVGGQYVLFLTSIPQSEDYTLLTGYNVGGESIDPVDFSQQFEAYKGSTVPAFLSTLDELLSKSSPR